MKLAIEHDYEGISAERFEEVYFDETFATALAATLKLGRTLVRLERTPERIVRHVRIEPEREIPAPVAKLLGGKRFAYVEELDYDVARHAGRWRIIPNVLEGKVDAGGTFELLAGGNGVKRRLLGDISVSVFGIGGLVERIVVSELERSYENGAVFMRQYVAG